MQIGLNRTEKIKWLAVILVTAMILLVPEGEIYTSAFKWFLAITTFFILLVAFELMDLMPVAVLMPAAYIAAKLAPMEVVYSSWLMTLPLVVVGGYMFANTLDRIGFLRRLAFFSILKVGGSYYGMLFGVFIAGMIINAITGGNAWIIMAAFTYGLCKSLKFGRSIDSAIIMLVGGFASGSTCSFIYSPFFMSVILPAARAINPDISVTWLQFFTQNIPLLFVILFVVWLTPKIFKPTQPMPSKEFFQEEYAKLGKMSTEEKIGMWASIVLIVFMLTGGIHGIALDWGFIIIPWLLFMPGIKIASHEDIRGIDIGMVFFVASCISIGVVSGYLGVGKVIADALVPVLSSASENIVLGCIYLLSVALNFLLTPLAIVAGFSEPVAQIASGLGMNPLAPLYAIIHGTDGILLPYEYMTYLVFYAFGFIKLSDFVKIMGLKIVIVTLVMFTIMPLWWGIIGLI